jgi:hypothetical protein
MRLDHLPEGKPVSTAKALSDLMQMKTPQNIAGELALAFHSREREGPCPALAAPVPVSLDPTTSGVIRLSIADFSIC